MQVAIIGTGNMGRGIGCRVLAGGHDLTVIGKDFEHAEAVAADIAGYGGRHWPATAGSTRSTWAR
jgi:3-hydroxyisobutyrate dehydrogenase-like beta-hydroxyacid dehydrogenase